MTAILTVAGVATFALALRKKVDLQSASPWFGVLIVPLVIGVAVLSFPYTFGPWLLILGLVALLLSRAYRLSSIAAALLVSGAMLTLQSLMYPVYRDFSAANPHVPILSLPTYALLKLTGLRCSMSGGVIYVQMMRNNWPFPCAWVNFALFPLVQMFVAAAVIIPLFAGEMKKGVRALWAFIIGMGYMIVRYAMMLLLFTYLMYFVGYFDDDLWITVFWNRALTVVSFIPLVLIFAKAFPLKRTGEALAAGLQLPIPAPAAEPGGRCLFGLIQSCPLKKIPTDGRKSLAIAFVALAVFFFVGYIGYWDSGVRKPGRILLDEKHTDWEISTQPYDTEWYGNESGYNYWSMADLLSHYYIIHKNPDKDLTADLLKNYDVLLLKNPTYPYSEAEQEAMLDFVERGGGIFLMGEHTNVFGTSVPLNSIGRHFGFYFRFDSVFDMEKKFEQLWDVPRLLAAPTVQNQRDFLFATSCSIERTRYFGSARNAAVAGGLWSLPIEYAAGNFYPQVVLRTDMTYGPLIQLITGTKGKGRVIGFTDSTTFSNFSSQLPGKPEMLLSSMNWLNHENRFNWLNTAFLVMSILCMIAAGRLAMGTPRHHGTRLTMLAVGVCAAALSMGFFTALTKHAYPMPKPHPQRPLVKIVFEKEFSEYEIPVSGFVKDQQRSFSIFYQWVLRLQYFPFLKYTVDDALAEKPNVLVMINPSTITPKGREFVDHVDAENVERTLVPRLRKYLKEGGSLLLMDDATNEKSLANMILEPLVPGMRIEGQRQSTPYGTKPQQQQTQMTAAMDTAGRTVCAVPVGLSVRGGTPLLTTADGKAVMAEATVGKGKVLVMSASKRFCDAKMGFSQNAAPNSDALQAYWLQYAMLTGLVDGGVDSEIQKVNRLSEKIGLR